MPRPSSTLTHTQQGVNTSRKHLNSAAGAVIAASPIASTCYIDTYVSIIAAVAIASTCYICHSLKKSLPLSSTTINAGKSSTSIFHIASIPANRAKTCLKSHKDGHEGSLGIKLNQTRELFVRGRRSLGWANPNPMTAYREQTGPMFGLA